MVKICEYGQMGCPECGGDRIHHGSGLVRSWWWTTPPCLKCDGKGWIPIPPPQFLPDGPSFAPANEESVEQVLQTCEVVILYRYSCGVGRFAVVCLDGEEIASIPILKEQSEQDEFFAALKQLVLRLVK
jgi:hypothetical protein